MSDDVPCPICGTLMSIAVGLRSARLGAVNRDAVRELLRATQALVDELPPCEPPYGNAAERGAYHRRSECS